MIIRRFKRLLNEERPMDLHRFLLGILSVWRITHLLQAEDGPWDGVVRLRRSVGDGFWGQLLDCFYCLSVWVAAPFAFYLGGKLSERILLWPALSAGAILLERVTDLGHNQPSPLFIEESREDHVMLWRKEIPSRPNYSDSADV
jgi:hypothetical protein